MLKSWLADLLVDAITDATSASILEQEEVEITEAFVVGESDTIISAADLLSEMSRQNTKWFGESRRAVESVETVKQYVQKTAMGTNQQSGGSGPISVSWWHE